MGGLTLYVDMVSQPSRAVVIFCRANKIPHQQQLVKIGSGEHKAPAFLDKFPVGKLPAIDDRGFLLSESHAIMRYLFATRPCADHWYPVDPQARAHVDMLLDWHHTNLRRGAATLLFQKWLAPMRGLSSSADIAADAYNLLKGAVATLERHWLADVSSSRAGASRRPRFLLGASAPSMADLSMASEMLQLKILGRTFFSNLLSEAPRVRQWLCDVEGALAPHFKDSMKVLNAIVDRREAEGQKQQGHEPSTGTAEGAKEGSFKGGDEMGKLYSPQSVDGKKQAARASSEDRSDTRGSGGERSDMGRLYSPKLGTAKL